MGEFVADNLTEEQKGLAYLWLYEIDWEGGVYAYFLDYNGINNAEPDLKALLKPESIEIIQGVQDLGAKVSSIFEELEETINIEKENE